MEQTSLVSTPGGSRQSAGPGGDRFARVFVLHTRPRNTDLALRRVAAWAREREVRVTILAAVEVPYRLPLTEPPVSLAFTKQLLSGQAMRLEADTTIELLLCRDPLAAIRGALGPGSTVVVGDSAGWWRRHPERKLARRLRAEGHNVFLVNPKDL